MNPRLTAAKRRLRSLPKRDQAWHDQQMERGFYHPRLRALVPWIQLHVDSAFAMALFDAEPRAVRQKEWRLND